MNDKTIRLANLAEQTVTTPSIPITLSTRRKTRPLHGTLGVAGCPWIIVNVGLLMILCQGCNAKQEIDQSQTFVKFKEDVETFSNNYERCNL